MMGGFELIFGLLALGSATGKLFSETGGRAFTATAVLFVLLDACMAIVDFAVFTAGAHSACARAVPLPSFAEADSSAPQATTRPCSRRSTPRRRRRSTRRACG